MYVCMFVYMYVFWVPGLRYLGLGTWATGNPDLQHTQKIWDLSFRASGPKFKVKGLWFRVYKDPVAAKTDLSSIYI